VTAGLGAGQDAVAAFSTLFEATSIALVGASESSLFSRIVVDNLRASGFAGDVHLVNPKHASQFGVTCRPSPADIPGPVDVAYVLTGHAALPSVIAACAEKGTAWAVVLGAGYRESGAEGARREDELARLARDAGIRLLGPNALGFLNVRSGLAAYGNPLAQPLVPGGVGIVSHSGGMAVQLHRLAVGRAIGVSRMASLGNCALVSACDLIEHLLGDADTAVIGCLLETLDPPERFRELAGRAVEAGKPLVVLKVGRSETSARVAIAHTGALAGDERIVDGFLRQLGVLRVGSLEELAETCGLLAARGWPRGPRTGVITSSGGASGIVADLALGTRIELREPSPATVSELTGLLGDNAAPQNPLDITGFLSVDPGALPRVADVLARDAALDAVVTVLEAPREPGPAADMRLEMGVGVARAVEAAGAYCLIANNVASELSELGRKAVRSHGLHYGNGLTLTVAALDNAIEYANVQRTAVRRREAGGTSAEPLRLPPLPPPERGEVLAGDAALELLAAIGIASPPQRPARSADEAAEAALAIGFPVVVKVSSPDVPHKTEVGGVVTDVRSAEEARAAYKAVIREAGRALPTARVDAALIVKQVDPVAELLVGAVDDPQFGPIVMLGAGGVFAELVAEVAVRIPPLDELEVDAMLAELRCSRLLDGFRGRPRGDRSALAAAVARVGRLALAAQGSLRELELNPLFVLPEGQGVLAGDVLVVRAST
jgi:acyl-CoA synthetase (NDP forming)